MKRKLSKKMRILRNILLIVLLLSMAQFFSGLPYPLMEFQYRLDERAYMVGPGEILGVEEIDFSWCDRIIVSETEEGAILWIYGPDYDRSALAYHKRGTGSLLMAPPGYLGYIMMTGELYLPLVLFDDCTKATRAEIQFTISDTINGEPFEKTYHLTAERRVQGYFLFQIDDASMGVTWAEQLALERFAEYASNQDQSLDYSIPIHICYYDSLNNLVAREEIAVTGAPGD